MAISSRIVTRHTPLFAVILVGVIVVTAWLVAELAPRRIVPQELGPVAIAGSTIARVPTRAGANFEPAEPRPDDRLCGWTADQIHRHFRAITAPSVELRARAIAGLTEAYLDLHCPSRIHDGNWSLNAEILGVGLVVESLQEQTWFAELEVRLDPRAAELVPTGTTTFEILAPRRMCVEAARGDAALSIECLEAFGWFY